MNRTKRIQDIIENEKCINNCGHCFCKPCLDGWLNTGKYTCPMCIQPIQYFKHNSENYRLIKPTQINTNTTNAKIYKSNRIDYPSQYFWLTKRYLNIKLNEKYVLFTFKSKLLMQLKNK